MGANSLFFSTVPVNVVFFLCRSVVSIFCCYSMSVLFLYFGPFCLFSCDCSIVLFVIVWILRMPVSIVIASFGVDCGTWRILFMMLFMIVCIFWLSLCVVVLLSAPYVSVCDKAGKTLLKLQLLAIHSSSYYFMSK